MSYGNNEQIIRDPLWNTIRLDHHAVQIVNTAVFQRQRYIRQLGFAHLVYPGATHTRFGHAIGVYHLATITLEHLRKSGQLGNDAFEEARLIPYAALLHDIGHYAFSHALEELGHNFLIGDHETVSARFFGSDQMKSVLGTLGGNAAAGIHDLIRGESENPLRGLVSGSLDLDKIEYLKRDALFCGVPYGEVDVDRLLQGMLLLEDPLSGKLEIGIDEKAVAALESLLFAKYQMFRNVYWHHGVRAASALYKRIVYESVHAGILTKEELVGPTDEELIYEIARRAQTLESDVGRRLSDRWIPSLRARELPKRIMEVTAAELGGRVIHDWVLEDSHEKRAFEDRLAEELGLESGEIVVDFPVKQSMFQLDLLIKRTRGGVERLDLSGVSGLIDLPQMAGSLYAATRVFRIFAFEKRALDKERVLEEVTRGL
mgnify:FL=1